MDIVLICGEVIRLTEKAVLYDIDGDETWIPKSVLENPDAINEGDTELYIARWFCDKEGII